MPNVINFRGERRDAEIIGVDPYTNSLKTSKTSSAKKKPTVKKLVK